MEFAQWCEARQRRRGKQFMGENPVRSQAWKEPELQTMQRHNYNEVRDQCGANLKDPWNGYPMRKKSKLVISGKCAAARMSLKCPGPEQHPRHQVVEGKTNLKDIAGQWIKIGRAEYAGSYTKDFCHTYFGGAEQDLDVVMRPRENDTMVSDFKRLRDEMVAFH